MKNLSLNIMGFVIPVTIDNVFTPDEETENPTIAFDVSEDTKELEIIHGNTDISVVMNPQSSNIGFWGGFSIRKHG